MHAVFHNERSLRRGIEEVRNMATRSRQSRQHGFALVFFCTMWAFVIACVGLAVDVGTIYMIKARLSAAADAAALAAGRAVNLATDLTTAQTNAQTTATQFFNANFPTGYFNSIGTPTVTPNLTQEPDVNGNPNGVLDIKVTASVSAPTYFMNLFKVHNINVAASGTASRRGLVLMLVLDQSSSMGTGAGSACEVMKTAAENFLTLLSPFDQVGLVTFDLTANMMDSPTTDHTQVNNDIKAIGCGSNTNTISALELAYEQIKKTNLPLALNTIILFTDGSPNGITASFPARAPAMADTRYSPALNPATAPAQTPPNDCGNHTTGGQTPVYGGTIYGSTKWYGDQQWNQSPCVSMPVVCTDATAFLYGAISQTSGQNPVGGGTWGLEDPSSGVIASYAPNAPDTKSIPASCNAGTSNNMRQYVAYIPDTDAYGNSLHGVAASTNSPYGSVVGGKETRDFWLFQTNGECSPNSTVVPNCKNTGGPWTGVPLGTGSNFFDNTNTYYGPPKGTTGLGYFRPDQPNTIVAASMNGTMAEAFRIRSDSTYHPVIHTIYLTGNGSDAVDHEFLAVVANAAQITALPYDATGTAAYANPAYQTGQETGLYLVTSDKNALAGLFAQLASEVLRLSK
jgi:Flp pilus assembly protein TadG